MRLPFISRSEYIAETTRLLTVAAHERENAQFLRTELVAERERFNDLLKRLHPFNDGLAPVGPPPVKGEPSPVSKIIREQASESGALDHALYTHLRKYARTLKAEGLSEDEICGKLVEWQNTETQFQSE